MTRTLLILALLATPASAAPPATYLLWQYDDYPHITYVLRNYKYKSKPALYVAEFTARNDVTGAVLGQEAFYQEGTYPWQPAQWPNGAWYNAPAKFHTVGTENVGAGRVVGEVDELPAWAVGLPDFYEW
jgi:hypothetical protein